MEDLIVNKKTYSVSPYHVRKMLSKKIITQIPGGFSGGRKAFGYLWEEGLTGEKGKKREE